MLKRDGSLVFFTILSQWSVGIIVCLTGLSRGGSLVLETGAFPANLVVLALVLVVVATTVSLLHLGNPVNAPKAARNLATSWLSREILAIGLFSACLVATLLAARVPGSAAYSNVLLPACSLAGLFLVWSMARVYRIPTVPAWDSGFTPLAFVSATLSLGLMTFLLLDASGALVLAGNTHTVLAGLLLALLALEMGAGIVGYYRLSRMDTGMDGPAFGHGFLYKLFRTRMALAGVACLLLGFFTLNPGLLPAGAALAGLFLAMALVVLQELAGRALFYASYFRIGL